ncbi:hypothetical protein CPB85DRAFT_1558074 [Mucidula mucida]|nr:hypothetical protein CPB85DRAFT_1558074 [Mucidula mucida]
MPALQLASPQAGNIPTSVPPKSAETTASVLLLTLLRGFQEVLKVVKESSDVCPPLKSAVGGFLACVDAYQKTAANHEEMEKLIKRMEALASPVARRLNFCVHIHRLTPENGETGE